MGYLDHAGLQHLWDKLKEKFAPKSHTHDDRYYTEAEMDGKLNSKVNNNEAGANGLFSKLGILTATPTDDTYFIRQDTGGGNTFGRVKFSTIWNYIKGKTDGVYSAKSHTHTKSQITDFPISFKNPTALTIQTNGTTAATYDGSAAKTVNITKGNIGLGNVDNTADANKSVKYATSAGSASTATKANIADTSNGVKDYNDANRTIKIGFAGDGLNASNLNYIAGYTDNGTKIKNVNKDVLKSWIGLGNYLPLSGGTMSGQITKSTGGFWIGDRDCAAIRSKYAGDNYYGAVAAMATKNGYWTMGNLGGNESLIFNYSTDANYNAGNNSTSQVYLPAQAGTIITSATIGNQTVNRAEHLANDADYMRMHWNGQSGQPTWLWGGNDASNMYVYNPSNFSVNYATTAGNGTVDFQTKVTTDGQFGAVRFGNGVQICWFTMKNTRNRTFLLPFADKNYAIAFSGGYCWVNINNRTTTGFTVGAEWSGYENSYIAIGRWK